MQTRQSHTGTGWSEFLFRLHRAHEELLAALEAVELLTRQLAPDPSLLGTARWKLSKASMCRRLLAAEIIAQLRARTEGGDRDKLLRLQEGEAELLALGTDHVRRWTAEEIAADREGFCEAARAMRLRLIARMAEERRVFHPLLRAGMRQAPWFHSSPWAAHESA